MDEKTEKILKTLASGKSREDAAKELGYKSYKSLDTYMRRKNFLYDSSTNNYVPVNSINKTKKADKEIYSNVPAKAASIIKMFEKEDADPKTIAKLMRFSSYSEMATYMKSKGYVWSNEERNYVLELGIFKDDKEAKDTAIKNSNIIDNNAINDENIERYIPLLDLLDKNKELLLDQLLHSFDGTSVPRYIIPGVFVTKSVHMSSSLDRLVKEYSAEKNISQREIFEVALIDFFKRYGYINEIETLLKS